MTVVQFKPLAQQPVDVQRRVRARIKQQPDMWTVAAQIYIGLWSAWWLS